MHIFLTTVNLSLNLFSEIYSSLNILLVWIPVRRSILASFTNALSHRLNGLTLCHIRPSLQLTGSHIGEGYRSRCILWWVKQINHRHQEIF